MNWRPTAAVLSVILCVSAAAVYADDVDDAIRNFESQPAKDVDAAISEFNSPVNSAPALSPEDARLLAGRPSDPCRDPDETIRFVRNVLDGAVARPYPRPYAPRLYLQKPFMLDLIRDAGAAGRCKGDGGWADTYDHVMQQTTDSVSAFNNAMVNLGFGDSGVEFRKDARKAFARDVRTIRLFAWASDLTHYHADVRDAVKSELEDLGYEVAIFAAGPPDAPCGFLTEAEACFLVKSYAGSYIRESSYSRRVDNQVGDIRDSGGEVIATIHEPGVKTTYSSRRRYNSHVSVSLMTGPGYGIVYTAEKGDENAGSDKRVKYAGKLAGALPRRQR